MVQDNINMDLEEMEGVEHGLDSSEVTGCCEQGDELSVSINCGVFLG